MSIPTLTAICIGQPKPFRGEESSAIDKHPVEGRVAIGRLGVAGDAVADHKHHGGPEMAVHHYPHDHYPMWRAVLGGPKLLERPAAFCENLVATGWIEDAVHICERFRIGTALLEISQPRQPCWKIEHRFGRKGMINQIPKTHACGGYYRVLEEGEAAAGDAIERVGRGHEEWSVAQVFAALFDPAAATMPDDLRAIVGLERLCPQWREKARELLEV